MTYELFRPSGSDSLTTSDSNEFNVLAPSASSFPVIFYQNRAEANRIDKALYLDSIATLYGVLREQSSLQRPSITIEYSRVPNFNYAYIAEFNRYYFVTTVTSVGYRLWKIDLNCDVLYSFKNEILQLQALVARSESRITPDIPDDRYKMLDVYEQHVVNYSNASTWHESTDYENMTYVMQFQGTLKVSQTGSDLPYTTPVATLVCNYSRYLGLIDKLNKDIAVIGEKTTIDHLISIYALPCYVDINRQYPVGYVDFPGFARGLSISGGSLYQPRDLITESHFTFDLSNYLEDDDVDLYKNTPPYKTITLEFNPFGTYDIPYSEIKDSHTLYLKVKINVVTGDAQLFYGGQYNSQIYLGQTNIAVRYPYTSSVYNINAQQHISNALSIAASVASENYAGAAAGTMNEIGTVAKSMSPATSVNQGAFQYIQKPRIYVRDVLQQDRNASLNGYPYYDTCYLSDLMGYAEIDKVHVEDLPKASIDEAQEVERLLKAGVIFPVRV